jgi:hypothetical protein
MLKVQRRIDRLERSFGLSDRVPRDEHIIKFVDSDGEAVCTLRMSDNHWDWIKPEEPAGATTG